MSSGGSSSSTGSATSTESQQTRKLEPRAAQRASGRIPMRSGWTPAPLAHLPQRRFGAQTAHSKVPVGLSRRVTHHASIMPGTNA